MARISLGGVAERLGSTRRLTLHARTRREIDGSIRHQDFWCRSVHNLEEPRARLGLLLAVSFGATGVDVRCPTITRARESHRYL
jgi:hypothetical protein